MQCLEACPFGWCRVPSMKISLHGRRIQCLGSSDRKVLDGVAVARLQRRHRSPGALRWASPDLDAQFIEHETQTQTQPHEERIGFHHLML